jgi:hypothetical protein
MVKLLALGDSHLDALKFAADLSLLAVDETDFCIVPGATAVGLRNPNAITNALAQFRAAAVAASHQDATHVLVHLGEVDCGFVMWWRQQKYGDSIEYQLHESLAAYRDFIFELQGMGFSRICITGASLPTIRDGVDFGEVASKRSSIKSSLEARTRLTQMYNDELLRMAKENFLSYFDISVAVINKSSGVVADYFRSSDPCDHHMDKMKTVGIWSLLCNDFILEKIKI